MKFVIQFGATNNDDVRGRQQPNQTRRTGKNNEVKAIMWVREMQLGLLAANSQLGVVQ